MSQHAETWDLIPWLVNGSASGAQRQRADAHLRDCAACRNELDLQQRVHAEMQQDAGVEQLPSASLQKLMAKIDASEEAPEDISPRHVAGSRTSSPWRWLLAAVIVESIGLMFLSAALLRTESRPTVSPYYTVTSPTPTVQGAVIRAVFAPQLSLQELQVLLDATRLEIVAGPTHEGVYSLALPSSTDPNAIKSALAALRAQPSVRFAEPVGELRQ